MLKYILTGIVLLLVGYAFGCFSTGYLVGKRNGMDIRSTGSGNIGTTNALRSMGAKAGAITFLGDLLKAFVPMLLVKYVYCAHMGYDPNQSVAYMYTLFTGLGVVLGHNFPVTLRFKGGKVIYHGSLIYWGRSGALYCSGGHYPLCLSGIVDRCMVYSYFLSDTFSGRYFFPGYTCVESDVYGPGLHKA